MSKTKTRSLQTDLQHAIDQMVESGAERGLQVAVYQRGVQVVDAVAGLADPASGRPVASETPFYCYSVCKAAASTIVHMVAERGVFGYEDYGREDGCSKGLHCGCGVSIRASSVQEPRSLATRQSRRTLAGKREGPHEGADPRIRRNVGIRPCDAPPP